MQLSSTEMGWVIGILQKGGNFTIHDDGNVSLTVTDEPEVTARLLSFIGTGKIRNNNSNTRYFLQRRVDIDNVLRATRRYLTGTQKEQADKVIEHMASWFDELDPWSPQRDAKVNQEFVGRGRISYKLREG